MTSPAEQILVVEDSATQAAQMRMLLEDAGFTVRLAGNGREGLESLDAAKARLVVTDLHMPEMDGLELVQAVKSRFAEVPVILTTAEGSEDIAAEALRRGAASYVPKKYMAMDLVSTVRRTLALMNGNKIDRELVGTVVSEEVCYSLANSTQLVPHVISQLKKQVQLMELCNQIELMQIATALDEALVNAIMHGNLEVASELREVDGGRAFRALAEERRDVEPYRNRRVHVSSRTTRDDAMFVIRDEGPGFDPASLPDPTDPANLEKPSGRGLLLINTFMDEVSHNRSGNEITMVKRKGSGNGAT